MADDRSGVLQQLQSEVTCPLCLDIFTDPKRLPCEHVYCGECLRGLASRSITGAISCPECRAVTPVPSSDVSQFSTPHQVNRLIEMYQENLKSAETRATEAATPQPATCKVHNSQPLALYCETCEKLVCRDCVIVSCTKNDHKLGFLDDMVRKYRKDLDTELEPVEALHHQVTRALSTISSGERELQYTKEAKLQQIESTYDSLVEILAQERRYFTDSVKKSFEEQESLNSAKKCEISRVLVKLESLIQPIKAATSKESKQSFLLNFCGRKQDIENVKKFSRSLSLTPERSPEMEVEPLNVTEFQDYCQAKSFMFRKGDSQKVHTARTLDLSEVPIQKRLEVELHSTPQKIVKYFFGLFSISAQVRCCRDSSLQNVDVKMVSSEKYLLSFVPSKRGRHELHVKHNGTHVCGSPIPMYVTVPPDQITTLGKPHVKELDDVAGIKYHEGKLYVSELGQYITVLDPLTKSIERKIFMPGVNETLTNGGYIYFTEITNHKLMKMDMNGKIVKSTGVEGDHPGQFSFPNGIGLGKNDEIYVCDSRNSRIQVFDEELKFIRVIGREGNEDGCFRSPDDLDFDDAGNVYIADQDNHRVQVLTPEDQHVRSIGRHGSRQGELDHPVSVAVHKNTLFVTDLCNRRISVFKTTGEFVTTFGEDILQGPECIAVDENGYIYVTDSRSRLLTF